MTGYADHNALVDAINLGQVRCYVRKPVAPEHLRELLADRDAIPGLSQPKQGQDNQLLKLSQVSRHGFGLVGVGPPAFQ